jgi:hypothetical protein
LFIVVSLVADRQTDLWRGFDAVTESQQLFAADTIRRNPPFDEQMPEATGGYRISDENLPYKGQATVLSGRIGPGHDATRAILNGRIASPCC